MKALPRERDRPTLSIDRKSPGAVARPYITSFSAAGQAERRTRNYKRHGTTLLFAAFDVKAETILGKYMARRLGSQVP